MRAKILGAAGAVAVTIATVFVAVGPAAGSVGYWYFGTAGGSQIRALNQSITSALTARSTVLTMSTDTDTNNLATAKAQGVLNLGAVKTSGVVKAVPGGREVISRAQVADVNLLGGLITATAITTTTTTSLVNGVISSTTHSDFANLHVAGVNLPVDIPQNYTVNVGGIATVVINFGLAANQSDNGGALGAGLVVTLLRDEGTANTGAEIDLTPVMTDVAADTSPDTGHGTHGHAYATSIDVDAGQAVGIHSDPTSPTTVFASGTRGHTIENSLAGVNLAPLGRIGAVKTTGVATNTLSVGSVTTTASLADINLLGGLITASAVTSRATATLSGASGASQVANLKVGSLRIPLNVKPNTVIKLGIGKVVVNQQIKSGRSITVRALDIVLGKAEFGLPAGAEIQIAVSSARVSVSG